MHTDAKADDRQSAPLLEARGLCVRFGGVTALDGVDFSLRPGEVHALMGENGAGKSTLIKCLSGVRPPDQGRILFAGKQVQLATPREAEAVGIATVFQEVGLIPHASVAENVCLGREPVRSGWPGLIRWRPVRERAREALARLGLADLDVTAELGSCSVAVQQLVSIARALSVRPRALILDEPTSSLDREESSRLLSVVGRLRDEGLGVILITHFLDQVDAVADRITVLRDGRLVGVHDAKGLSRAKLISEMIGRDLGPPVKADPVAAGSAQRPAPLLAATDLGRRGALERIDLDIIPGEVVGLAGLLGSGRTETARVLFGADAPDRGQIRWRGTPVRFSSPGAAIAHGLAMTPENRKTEGAIQSLSVRENIALALLAKRGVRRWIPGKAQRALADKFIKALGIKTPDAEAPISSLSGGNQQKALLARWLATEPALLILDEPTRGIDIAAKEDLLALVEKMRDQGMAVLLISSELEEVVRSSSRVIVLRDRRTVAELSGAQVTEEAVLAAVAERHE